MEVRNRDVKNRPELEAARPDLSPAKFEMPKMHPQSVTPISGRSEQFLSLDHFLNNQN